MKLLTPTLTNLVRALTLLLMVTIVTTAQVTVRNMIPSSWSAETNQDCEPNLAVNPANPMQIAGSAFTFDTATTTTMVGNLAPIFVSSDGGVTWFINTIVPSVAGIRYPTGDINLRFGGSTNVLYVGILRGQADMSFPLNILRTNNFVGLTPMTVLLSRANEDQPRVASTTVIGGADAGKDRVYIGNNNFASSATATVDLSLDAATGAAPAGFGPFGIELRSTGTANQDAPPILMAIHKSGVIYAAFLGWRSRSGSVFTSDVVVMRDNNWGSGATPFRALVDSGDGQPGQRVVTGVSSPFINSHQATFGQERFVASDLSLAVDPNDERRVYVAWSDGTGPANYTLHARFSTDSGQTWSADRRTLLKAKNPSLAINSAGKVGLLYQQVTGSGASQRWVTHFERTSNDFTTSEDFILANTDANTPVAVVDYGPYLGDYVHVMAVGKDFYGIFSASNFPNATNFYPGTTFQRYANWNTNTLFADAVMTVPVTVSIDPFFFHVAESGHIQVPSAIAFGSVCAGGIGRATLNICNTGAGDLSVSGITSSNSQFVVTTPSGGYPVVISPGSCFPFEATFIPTTSGPQTATFTVASDDPTTPSLTVGATAQSEAGSLGLSPDLRFIPTVIQSVGNCQSSRPFVISNTGTCNLRITNVAIGGVNAGDFSLSGLPAFPITLQPGHIVGSGDLDVVFAPNALARERTASITVTFDDPASGTTSTQTRQMCGEGVRTGARVLVTQGGVPMAMVHEIELKRYFGLFGRKNEVDEVKNAPLQTVAATPGTACGPLQFHREYGAASNPTQLRPGVYELKVEAKIAGHEVTKKVYFSVDTCGFDGTIVVDF